MPWNLRIVCTLFAGLELFEAHYALQVAKLLQVLTSSPHRQEPACPAYARCGGCALQHMTYAAQLEAKGAQVFICAAGMAAHLAGAVAARTIRPVIGIPISGSAFGGMDSLLSTVQMPPGFPVATVATDKAGARNAAWLAAQILALTDKDLADRIRAAREKMKADIEKAGAELSARYN